MASTDFLPAMSAIGTVIVGVFGYFTHRKQKDLDDRLATVEQTPQPPSTDQVLELYNTADKTLQALNKFARAKGRGIQAEAFRISEAANADPADTSVEKPSLVGGGVRAGGGIIRKR